MLRIGAKNRYSRTKTERKQAGITDYPPLDAAHPARALAAPFISPLMTAAETANRQLLAAGESNDTALMVSISDK